MTTAIKHGIYDASFPASGEGKSDSMIENWEVWRYDHYSGSFGRYEWAVAHWNRLCIENCTQGEMIRA